MLRLGSNSSVIDKLPVRLELVMTSKPGMVENSFFSSGRATEVAMVSGLAPGNWPVTLITGES